MPTSFTKKEATASFFVLGLLPVRDMFPHLNGINNQIKPDEMDHEAFV
ncbi:hypothetical protein [Limnohabitans sp. 2KL-1]|nr:hypothetical protein [Limnohabitans sp. 2KL-1]